jgi:hypothetical protein
VTVEVNVGVTADTVRAELVSLATVLNAGVKNPHVYCNANGTATSDFIQVSFIKRQSQRAGADTERTDRIALPYCHVRELHTFNAACQIKTIVG